MTPRTLRKSSWMAGLSSTTRMRLLLRCATCWGTIAALASPVWDPALSSLEPGVDARADSASQEIVGVSACIFVNSDRLSGEWQFQGEGCPFADALALDG